MIRWTWDSSITSPSWCKSIALRVEFNFKLNEKKVGNSKFTRGMSFLIKIICTKMNAMDEENAISSRALEWHIIKRHWVDLYVSFFVLHALSQWGHFWNSNCVRASTIKCHWAFHVETTGPNLHCFNYTSLSPVMRLTSKWTFLCENPIATRRCSLYWIVSEESW